MTALKNETVMQRMFLRRFFYGAPHQSYHPSLKRWGILPGMKTLEVLITEPVEAREAGSSGALCFVNYNQVQKMNTNIANRTGVYAGFFFRVILSIHYLRTNSTSHILWPLKITPSAINVWTTLFFIFFRQNILCSAFKQPTYIVWLWLGFFPLMLEKFQVTANATQRFFKNNKRGRGRRSKERVTATLSNHQW